MTKEHASEERAESDGLSLSAALDDERVWLLISLLAGSIITASYYLNHPYPSYATALFPHMAEVLIENGYRRPETIPFYTEGGVPFAYPPLMFYVMAILIDLGVDPFVLIRLLPGIAITLALIPYFYLAREFLSVREAGFATVILAVAPQVVRWHISGGGTVRGPAFLLVITGLYVGVRLFKTRDRQYILPGAVLFGLAMLTHPVYMAYFGISYLVLFAVFDPTVRGLLHGAAVATVGAIIGAPWWLSVSLVHGPETILNASETHGGLFDSELEGIIADVLLFHNVSYPSEMLIASFVLIGGVYMLSKRRYALPVWFVVTTVMITQPRFAYVPGAMLIGAAVAGGVVPWLAEVASGEGDRTAVTTIALVALVCTTTWFGALYVTGDPPGEDRNAMSSYVDHGDIEAMEWASEETSPDATFVVLGDQAEWFPYVAERTGLTGWWGVEWTTPEQYLHQRALHTDLTACNDEACVNETIDEYGIDPDYVYVPNGEYTIGSNVQTQDEELLESMDESERYDLVYENESALIFEVVE